MGAVLGGLVVVQFFVSTELLAVSAIVAFVGLVVLAVSSPRRALPALRAAAPGLLVGFVIASAVLAYPAWFAVAGPRHITGPVFPDIGNLTSTLAASVVPHGERAGVRFISGGNGAYLGVPLLASIVVAAWVWRRDAALRFSVLMTAIAYVFSLGAALHVGQESTGVPLPAWILQHVPLLDSIFAARFAVFVDLFAGMSLAIVLDRLHAGDLGALARTGLRRRAAPLAGPTPGRAAGRIRGSPALARLRAGSGRDAHPPTAVSPVALRRTAGGRAAAVPGAPARGA